MSYTLPPIQQAMEKKASLKFVKSSKPTISGRSSRLS